ncbi:MAG: hypothetical protein HY521_11915 [Proteobacteria bacterium]|nr:hypothetical protein [Pseudomonadota bacterium]
MALQLLTRFRELFAGHRYLHRSSNLGDSVAQRLFEDLVELGRSAKYRDRVVGGVCVLNVRNTRRGVRARRGDGAFGEAVPGAGLVRDTGFTVARGPIATVEIGIEVKILAKAMIKQIDRVMTVLLNQRDHFRRGGDDPICVGIVGINYADHYTSYEGDRTYPTNGGKYPHPIQEAAETERRLREVVAPKFDEFLVLRFRAYNVPPYAFEWVNAHDTELDYGAVLTRVSREYERRF